MAVIIDGVERKSPAEKAGVRRGDTLLAINGRTVEDVLDYRFLMTDETLLLELSREGKNYRKKIRKDEYEDLGLAFESYLMDTQKSCRNNCVFCFIDQLPKGLRDTLYFKDDDARLSFLLGNYITLTNLSERDVERICEMHISPVNVSVHTTNSELRCQMMNNRFAGECLPLMRRFAAAGIKMNAQLVLCPGLNDGAELDRSMCDLGEMWPAVESVSAVPVGVTKYREGLYPLSPFTKAEAQDVVTRINRFGDEFERQHGVRLCYPSDEFFLLSGKDMPPESYYDGFPQLDNGVGMLRLFYEEFIFALEETKGDKMHREVSVATGAAAYDFIVDIIARLRDKWPETAVRVYRIDNDFFGHTVTVSGLVTGGDLVAQLEGNPLGSKLIIPSTMLRFEGDLFLDSVALSEVSTQLRIPVAPTENDGAAFLQAILEE